MKLEMHAHDCEVSQCAVITAKELVDGYQEAGYDGIVITNHFDTGTLNILGKTPQEQYEAYVRGYELCKEEGDRVGLTVILGMEIRLDCGPEDFLVYGVTKEFIREHMDICTKSQKELYEICDKAGCLLIQAHPFRTPCEIQDPRYLHGVERNFNSGHDNHNEKLDAWLQEEGRAHMIVTQGSDCHDVRQIGLTEFVLDTMVKDSAELVEALKK